MFFGRIKSSRSVRYRCEDVAPSCSVAAVFVACFFSLNYLNIVFWAARCIPWAKGSARFFAGLKRCSSSLESTKPSCLYRFTQNVLGYSVAGVTLFSSSRTRRTRYLKVYEFGVLGLGLLALGMGRRLRIRSSCFEFFWRLSLSYRVSCVILHLL